MVKQSILKISLKKLDSKKQSHSKVKQLKHPRLITQSYLLPNDQKISKEEILLIFKIRSRVLNVKMNLPGMYDSFECEICEKNDETQKHIYECTEIWKNKEIFDDKIPEYEDVMTGNVKEQLKVAKIMKENLEIYEKLKNKK